MPSPAAQAEQRSLLIFGKKATTSVYCAGIKEPTLKSNANANAADRVPVDVRLETGLIA